MNNIYMKNKDNGCTPPIPFSNELPRLKALFSRGDIEAGHRLARGLMDCSLGIYDPIRAFEVTLKMASGYDDPEAINNLGWFYENDVGAVRRNRSLSRTCYERAAQKGYPLALSNMADHLLFCDFYNLDVLRGISFAQTAAFMGEPHAMLTLTYCFQRGIGVVQDTGMAKEHYDEAMKLLGKYPGRGEQFGVTHLPRKACEVNDSVRDMKESLAYLHSGSKSKREIETVWVHPGLECYPEVFSNLRRELELRGIPFRTLPAAKDKKHIWVRDYMPYQIGKGRFLQQVYSPDYLADGPEYIPDYNRIVSEIHPGRVDRCQLIIDGGNMIRAGKNLIMTDKVFWENPQKNAMVVADELVYLTRTNGLVILPWDMSAEPYGHADGMVRDAGCGCVVMNNFCNYDPRMRNRLHRILSNDYNVLELHFEGKLNNSLNWGYINFLQVGERLFVPQFGIQEDSQALEQLGGYFPGCEIIPIFGCESLAKDGGVLNCVTWNVKME